MPCVHRRRREEREEYIRQNRREVDPYAGIADPVEILRVLHTPRPHDPSAADRSSPRPTTDRTSDHRRCASNRAISSNDGARQMCRMPRLLLEAKTLPSEENVTELNMDPWPFSVSNS